MPKPHLGRLGILVAAWGVGGCQGVAGSAGGAGAEVVTGGRPGSGGVNTGGMNIGGGGGPQGGAAPPDSGPASDVSSDPKDARAADGPSPDGPSSSIELPACFKRGTGGSANFSFFYTGLEAMKCLSGSDKGFGGDLRFGEKTGLAGADKICQTIATGVGGGHKTWRAFLSAVRGAGGQPEHAIDRIGEGPWHDRQGRLIAMNKAGLLTPVPGGLGGGRPQGDPQAVADLADETGSGTKVQGDTHDVITGTNAQGRLMNMNLASTCQDWTSTAGRGPIWVGHAWPARTGSHRHWINAHIEASCAPGVNLVQDGPGDGSSIGAGGGWGGFYCFALTP